MLFDPTGEPRFVPGQAAAMPGTVVFFIRNMRGTSGFMPQDHNMAIGPEIYDALAHSSYVRIDKAAVFTVEGMTPGTYTFWCEVGMHAAEGMAGTLTVVP